MTRPRPVAKILLVALSISMAIPSSILTAEAAQPSSHVFAVPQTGVTFLTGDSWQQAGQTMRLYGVQACIRGTTYTDNFGQKQDCGAVSLAMLAAIFKDTKPTCAPLAQVATAASAALDRTRHLLGACRQQRARRRNHADHAGVCFCRAHNQRQGSLYALRH